MNTLSLIKDFMILIGFSTLLFAFCYTIFRFITYVKTLHFIEDVQDDILDNECEISDVKSTAKTNPPTKDMSSPISQKPNLDKSSDKTFFEL